VSDAAAEAFQAALLLLEEDGAAVGTREPRSLRVVARALADVGRRSVVRGAGAAGRRGPVRPMGGEPGGHLVQPQDGIDVDVSDGARGHARVERLLGVLGERGAAALLDGRQAGRAVVA
jgi:hypothetical protein